MAEVSWTSTVVMPDHSLIQLGSDTDTGVSSIYNQALNGAVTIPYTESGDPYVLLGAGSIFTGP